MGGFRLDRVCTKHVVDHKKVVRFMSFDAIKNAYVMQNESPSLFLVALYRYIIRREVSHDPFQPVVTGINITSIEYRNVDTMVLDVILFIIIKLTSIHSFIL
jgi:hypothetical protein